MPAAAIRKPKPKAAAPKKKASGSQGKASASGGRVDAEKKTETKTTKSGPYDAAFQQHLIDHGILPYGYTYPNGNPPSKPGNHIEIRERLAQRRSSLSHSLYTDNDHQRFLHEEAGAANEQQVIQSVLPHIEGPTDGTTRGGPTKFANLKSMTMESTVPGYPDIYYGARTEEIELGVRTVIGDLIIPSAQVHLPAAPNFFVACKGPSGTASVAQRQALYDGAIGARGIQALRSFQGEDVYDGNAYCISSFYSSGLLRMFTIHPVQADNGRLHYVMTLIKGWDMIGDAESFRSGATAYRNLRDWAKEQRDSAIQIANGRVLRD